jgi:hypothetical protein
MKELSPFIFCGTMFPKPYPGKTSISKRMRVRDIISHEKNYRQYYCVGGVIKTP